MVPGHTRFNPDCPHTLVHAANLPLDARLRRGECAKFRANLILSLLERNIQTVVLSF